MRSHVFRSMVDAGGGRYFRGVAVAAAVALAATVVDVVGVPAAAVAAPAKPPAKPACPEQRADRTSALVTAKLCGKQVEITDETTIRSRTWAKPDGSLSSRVHSSQVRMRQADKWVDIDPTLRKAADGSIGAVAHPGGLRLTGAVGVGRHDLASVSTADDTVTMEWDGELREPVLEGNRATYREALPGVDLVVRATTGGFEQLLVVKNAAAAERVASFKVPLKSKKLRFVNDAPGAFAIKDAKGKTVGRVPTPLAWDAAAEKADGPRADTAMSVAARSAKPGAVKRDAKAPVAPQAKVAAEPQAKAVESAAKAAAAADAAEGTGRVELEVSADPGWLKDAARSWPVTLDPAIELSPEDDLENDTYIKRGVSEDRSGTNDLQMGFGRLPDNSITMQRTLMTWKMPAFSQGAHIKSASLNLYNFYSGGCWDPWQAYTVEPYTVPVNWETQPAWNQWPSHWSWETRGNKKPECGATAPNGWVKMDVREIFARAADAGSEKAYLGLRAENEGEFKQYKQFRSKDENTAETRPYITIDYDAAPYLTNPNAAPSTGGCVTGSGRPSTTSLTPQLRVNAQSENNAASKVFFEWRVVDGATFGNTTVENVPSGSTAHANVPAGAFKNGGTYGWRAKANNGSRDSLWTPWCEFTVDNTKPDVPYVSSATYPSVNTDNSWGHGGKGQAGQFSFTPTGASTSPITVAEATSSNSRCADNEGPEKAIDGAVTTKWCTKDTANRVLKLRLNAEQVVTGVTVRHAGANGEDPNYTTKDYDLQLSTDDQTYWTALQVRGNTAAVTANELAAPGKARFAKLVVLNPTQNNNSTTRIVDLNLLGGTKYAATADGGSPGCAGNETAAQAFDGNLATKWCTFDNSKWLQADLGGVRDLTNIVLRHAQAGGEDPRFNLRDYDLTLSENGTTWTKVLEIRANVAGSTNHRLPAAAKARYIRLDVITPTQDGGSVARVVEFEAYRTTQDSDVVGYTYQLDSDTAPTNVGAGNPTTVSITPSQDGRRTLTVRARDVAGNLSEPNTYIFNVGRGGLSEPRPGAVIAKRTKLTVSSDPALTRVTFRYRRGPGGTEYDVPLAHLRTSAGAAVAAYPVPLATLGSNATWNAVDTLGATGGVAQVRALLWPAADGQPAHESDWTTVTIDPNGDGAAADSVGPGSVNLLTGDYSLSSTDADEFGLSVSRSASSREPTDGWLPQGERLTGNQLQIATDASGFMNGGGVATLTRSTARGQGSSTDSLSIMPAGSAPTGAGAGDTFASIGADQGGLQLGMKAGKRYRVSGWIYVPGTTGLSPTYADRGLRIVGFYKDAAGYHAVPSTKAAWTDAWQELTVDLAIPAGATEAFFRLYNGHAYGSGKDVFYDNLSVKEVVAPFGPQWRGGAADGIGSSDYTTLMFTSPELAKVTNLDGTWLTFARNNQGQFFPEPGAEDLTLTKVDDNTYRMTDLDATVTEFKNENGTFVVATTWTADAGSTSRYLYESADKRTLVKRVINPVEPGIGDCATPVPARGCEVLEYDYATATTATSSALGDIVDQVRSVKVWSWDPNANATTAVEVARYAYDNQGRLREVWDPRLPQPIKNRYAYDNAGRVTALASAGQLQWDIDYGTTAGDDNPGRLHRVRRATLKPGTKDQLDGEVATNVVYNVPLTRAAGGPHDVNAAAVATWGQKDTPTDATAIFGPETDPDTNSASAAKPGLAGYTYATAHYLNANGQEINTATPGGHLDSRTYDQFGNEVWSLEATNRALALGALPDAAAKIAELNLPADTTVRANLLASTKAYSPDGLDLIDQLGPVVKVALENDLFGDNLPTLFAGSEVIARSHTTFKYDEGKPDGGTYHLETTETVGAQVTGGYPDADVRIARTGYNAEKGGTSGWKLKKSTSVTNDSGTAYIVYDDAGRTLKSWGIDSDGNDARTALTHYYTAGAHPNEADCGNKPEWAGQPCITKAAGAVTGQRSDMTTQLPVKKVEAYSRFGDASIVAEFSNGKTRRTTTAFDNADRVISVGITSDEGTALPVTTTDYDPGTGLTTATRSGGKAITREYDLLGRVLTYTDADGGVTRSEFDRYGKATKTTDDTGTTTFTYDRNLEPRGMVTAVTDSIAGTFNAKYSPDGQLVQVKYPGGMTRTDTFNASFAPVGRAYTRDADNQVIYAETVVENTVGQSINHTYTGGFKTYGYDKLRRLSFVEQTTAGACTTRTYTHDNRTNRHAKRSYNPGAGGTCRTDGLADAEEGHTYDSADRLTDPGYAYDSFGRTTAIPEGMTSTYYANDLVAGQQLGDIKQNWTLDPAHRIRGWTTSTRINNQWANATSKVNHYGDDSDEPRYIVEDVAVGSITRNVSGPDGDLAAITSNEDGVRLQLTNLHGDVAATIDSALTSPMFAFFDEFGVAARGQDDSRYGWFGGKQRSAEALGGSVLMGVRVYLPAAGRFSQVDPVPGGSATAYDYCHADPMNCTDLDGKRAKRKKRDSVAPICAYTGDCTVTFLKSFFQGFAREKINKPVRKVFANPWVQACLVWAGLGVLAKGGEAGAVKGGLSKLRGAAGVRAFTVWGVVACIGGMLKKAAGV
jgi:RHS repeat-associated protein